MKHIKLFENFKGNDFNLLFKVSDTEGKITAIQQENAALSLFESQYNGFRDTFICYDKEYNEHTFQVTPTFGKEDDTVVMKIHVLEGNEEFIKECLTKDIEGNYYYDYELATRVSLNYLDTINELNHQTPDSGDVNNPGRGQGAHHGNWGVNYGDSGKGVRGHFGKKGDVNSPNLDQKGSGITVPEVVHDPTTDKMLTQDEVQELLRLYDIKSKQKGQKALDFRGINSRVIKFIRDYLKYY